MYYNDKSNYIYSIKPKFNKLMKTITTTFFVFFISFLALAEVSVAEKEALVKFYHATNGNQWKKTWDLKAATSTWYGVKIKDNKVVGLELPNNKLKGQIPAEISNLKYLETLDLFKNDLNYFNDFSI